ncbi:AraC family transcriptional regulator [Bacterioplanes sanyensis]|uniref:AraC family transcriptional regulator n=1 Tax=Bacterioplanes sanyensis TaxID=1249553 RepID=A0A222FNS5_9GAMM|nr:AraC family transcriptional regulator [Bacterioplanes sanyensis]ASP40362.1 AraC family transcriptional regulator [Bacterioplanes sanyensis]
MFQQVQSGYAYIDKLHNEDHHSHEDYVLTLLLAGYVTLDNQQPVLITPGCMTLVPSGTPHALLSGQDMQVHWLSFSLASHLSGEQQELMRPFQLVRQGALPIVKIEPQRLTWLASVFEQLQMALEQNFPATVINSLVTLILHEARWAAQVDHTSLSPDTHLGKAMSFIEQHSQAAISLKDVAAAVHLSPAHLATKMKQATGYSVGQWIIKHRLRHACERLAGTDHPVEKIVHMLGWKDVTHFIRQFKKAYGVTPAAWRRQRR